MFVNITLLPTLRCLQPLPDLLNKLYRLENYLSLSHDHVTDLYLTEWGTALPPIEKLKWKRTETRVLIVVVVVRKISQRKVGVPNPTKIDHTCLLHILEHLDGSLALVVRSMDDKQC